MTVSLAAAKELNVKATLVVFCLFVFFKVSVKLVFFLHFQSTLSTFSLSSIGNVQPHVASQTNRKLLAAMWLIEETVQTSSCLSCCVAY